MRIKFNEAGFDQLLTSAGAQALVEAQAQQVADRANRSPSTTDPATDEPYYEVEDGSDEKRARRRVKTASVRAIRHEAKTQALQRAING